VVNRIIAKAKYMIEYFFMLLNLKLKINEG